MKKRQPSFPAQCFRGLGFLTLFFLLRNPASGAALVTHVIHIKIDVYVNTSDTATLVDLLVASLSDQSFDYVFLHLKDPDATGHASGWEVTPGSAYCNTIAAMDACLGHVFGLIDSDPRLMGCTAILLTADHGGIGYDHSDPTLPEDYTVPFYVWGPGVMSGADLYALNPATRLNPGAGRPPYSAPIQPIRNGEAANVALQLLGLGPVPGSTLDAAQDLALTIPSPADFRCAPVGPGVVLSFSTVSNALYDIQSRADLNAGSWSNCVVNLLGTGTVITNLDAGAANADRRFYRLRIHF